MSFVFHSIRKEDLDEMFRLSQQFSLLNLPADKKVIGEKIETSMASFAGELKKQDCRYVFVVEDTESKKIAATSQIVAQHGNPETPNYSFRVLKKELFSKDLGIGFIHQVLRLRANTDGPTEIGGLVVDQSYRRRPEKVGRLASLARFIFIGHNQELFKDELHAEMAPPLTDEGRSEFWEALGRRFTGMPYQEADVLSTQNKEFIQTLFPSEDIYLCLLDSKSRLVMGRVSEETEPALRMLEKLGFSYKNEVDPFDGGPHLGVKTSDVPLIRNGKIYRVKVQENVKFGGLGFFGYSKEGQYYAGSSSYAFSGGDLCFPKHVAESFDIVDKEVFFSVFA